MTDKIERITPDLMDELEDDGELDMDEMEQ